MKPLKILEIASELPPVHSGVARSAGRVVEGLRERGHEIDCLTSADAFRYSIGEFRFSALGHRWLRLRKLVAGYDLVHLTGPVPFIADSLLARWRVSRLDLPPLVYTHNFDLNLDQLPRASALYQRVLRPFMKAADVMVLTTPSYEQRYASLGVATRVIPWATELTVRTARRPVYDGTRPLEVLFVGQQRPYKGIAELIDASAGHESLRLTIVGGGPNAQDYRDRSLARGATNICHLGRIPDEQLERLLADSDVICLPSTNTSEAFGIVLLEGMVAGCVAVASDLPGVRDVVGDAGILVEPRDVASLRSALLGLARQPARVRALRRAATIKAGTYSWPATIDAYECLYVDLVHGARSHP